MIHALASWVRPLPVLGSAITPAGGRWIVCASTVLTAAGRVAVAEGALDVVPPPGVGVAVFDPVPPPVVEVAVGTDVFVGAAVDVAAGLVAVEAGLVGVDAGGVAVEPPCSPHRKLMLLEVFIEFSTRIVFAVGGTFAVLRLNDTGLVLPAGKVWLAPGTGTKSGLPGM